MFEPELLRSAEKVLSELRGRSLRLATAESCTGGLIAGVLTEIPGSSDVVERGFVTYSNQAKRDCLGVPAALLDAHGAVSAEVALAMADGALAHAAAEVSIAVTGVAGPGGGSPDKPIGLVHLAAAMVGRGAIHEECRFGDIGRGRIRIETIRAALALIRRITAPEIGPGL